MENIWAVSAFRINNTGWNPTYAAKNILVEANNREEAEEKALKIFIERRGRGTHPDPVRDLYRISNFVTGPYENVGQETYSPA